MTERRMTCPFCASTRTEKLTFTERPIARMSGVVDLHACGRCGGVFISYPDRVRIENNAIVEERQRVKEQDAAKEH